MKYVYCPALLTLEIVRVGWANMWCGEMQNFFAMQPAAEIGAFRTPNHVVECEFLLGTGNPLQRSRRSDIQTCGKMQI